MTVKNEIRPIKPRDRAAWNVLWKGYVKFYKASVPDDVTECLWWRLHDATSTVKGIVATKNNRVIGFAHYVLTPGTWGRNHICYLEDLFVTPAARGQGAAQGMIEWLRAEAGRLGWTRVFWMTGHDNKTAQRLYDRIAQRTKWVRYDLDLDKPIKRQTSAKPQ